MDIRTPLDPLGAVLARGETTDYGDVIERAVFNRVWRSLNAASRTSANSSHCRLIDV
jgi:hypothetical protein